MMHDTATDYPGRIWRQQGEENPPMSLEEVLFRAGQARARLRRNLAAAFGLSFLLLVLSVVAMLTRPSAPMQIISAAMIVLTLVGAYQAYHRIWRPQSLPPSATAMGCLEFYRRELRAGHGAATLTFRFLVPAVVFLFLTWGALFETSSRAPRLLLPSVLVLILFVRRYEARMLRRELARLEEFDGETS